MIVCMNHPYRDNYSRADAKIYKKNRSGRFFGYSQMKPLNNPARDDFGAYSYWLLLVAFIVLAAGNLLKGV
jgi:hypothetical protein